MQNIIRIKGATFYGYHGVMSEEQSVGGKFEADVDIYTDFSEAAKMDSLHQTINYQKAFKVLQHVVLEHKYYLIEAVADRIAEELFTSFAAIKKIAVRVRKNNPPLGGVVDYVEVEVIKERKDFH